METEKTTVSNHYYNGGINFIGCNMPGATFQTVNPVPADTPAATPPHIPESLTTPRARDLLAKLVQAELLDEAWQPCGLSTARRGVLASLVAQKLGIGTPWQTFGTLWGVKPETLRRKYNEGLEQKQMGEFMAQITNLLK